MAAVQYARFVPVLLSVVLPNASSAADADAAPAVVAALRRLAIFFDHLLPGLALLGVLSLPGASTARRLWRVALAAGLALFVLRYTLPALFRDAKEVELLAAPVAVAVAAACAWLWTRRWGRVIAVASGVWIAAWGAGRAVALYAERFVALGR